ncbi:type II toxin-antitoxin system VapC family toxin [Salana multivorans]
MTFYIDTSAAAKLMVDETESEAMATWADHETLVSSQLLETELRRLAVRMSIPQTEASAILERIDLFALTPSLFHEAGVLPGPGLRSLDALHLASALRLGVAGVVTYDSRMTRAATDLGLAVVAPQ